MSSRLDAKKKPPKKAQVPLGIQEPVRESLLEVLCDNLELARRNIYVNRMIYLGEHSFETDTTEGVSDVFRAIVKEINGSYFDEPLTGIFLHYKKYFVHMLEGSEDSIMKHFQLLQDEEIHKKFSNLKLVTVINHINQRFINEWIDIPGKPATLLEKIDPDCDMEKSGRYIFNCIQKVYQLCREIREIKTLKNESDDDFVMEFKRKEEFSVSFDSSFYEEVLKAYYPEINLLQFLVQTRYLKSLTDYIHIYGCPVVADTYQDEIWPVSATMVPYTIFEKPLDPCTDLPTHKVEQVEEVLVPEDEIQPEITESIAA